MDRDLYLEQRDLEVQAVQMGEVKYHLNRLQNQASANSPELEYIQKGMAKLVPAIDDIKRGLVEGRRGLKGSSTWGIPFLIVDSDHLALLTLSSIYNMSGGTMAGIAKDVADRVLLQVIYETVKHEEEGVVSWIDLHERNGVKSYALTALRKRARNYTTTRWSTRDKVGIGGVLVGLALRECEELEHCKVYTSTRQYANGVKVRDEIKNRIESKHAARALLYPAYLPMVVPPMDWTNMWDGGYLLGDNEFSCVQPIIREGLDRELKRESIESLGLHVPAINHLQQTRWYYNQYILDLCKDIDINQAEVGRVIGTIPKALPNQETVDWDDPEEKKNYCIAARPVHEYNRKTVGKRTLFYQLQTTAKKMKNYDEFYFAWSMDFRARFYPRFCGFDPQGDKLNKAYLKFAHPEPLGPDGYEQLTLHLANSAGLDKLSLPDRISGILEREDEVRSWVSDPLRNSGWTEEDGPYLLAIAEEWVRATDSKDRENFLSHMPCAIDGKCNGLQHLSALARDPVGAFSTCLVPSPEPQDIYMAVKAKVDEFIEETIKRANLDQIRPILPDKIEAGEQRTLSVEEREMRKRQQNFYAALNWRGKTTRKLVKRGAMTWAYGVTLQGIMDQLIADGFLDDIEGNMSVNAAFMRDAIYWGVNNTVESARGVMEWLQSVAVAAFDLGKPVRWTNPAGMLVTQEYLDSKRREVETVTGRFSFMEVNLNERNLKRQKQINGIAPNFVHSIDAAHMANVVLRLKEEGIRDMHMVHDSYGVHASRVPLLHRIVREEFVKIHSRNLLEEFKQEVEKDLGIELPPYPEQGDFDVRQVLDSTYAFS